MTPVAVTTPATRDILCVRILHPCRAIPGSYHETRHEMYMIIIWQPQNYCTWYSVINPVNKQSMTWP